VHDGGARSLAAHARLQPAPQRSGRTYLRGWRVDRLGPLLDGPLEFPKLDFQIVKRPSNSVDVG